MEQPTREHTAAMLRERARQIRQHVEEVCSSVSLASRWLAVAEACEQRAAESATLLEEARRR